MNKAYIILVTAFICIFSRNTFAQLDVKAPKNFTIHSPNATGLGEYNAYPVDLSTGVPQINIPLYTITSGKISVPLSLSYHASGIKVDQEASFVGLGWVLNAGGVITRSLKDRADESLNGFKTVGQSIPNYNSIDNINGAGAIANDSTLKAWFEGKDKEPDLFNISATGLNDEFCYDNRGKFVSTRFDSLQYTADFATNLITVTDRAGNLYRFGRGLDNSEAFETTGSSSQSTNSNTIHFQDAYVSSWYLTEIISADLADTISFKYQSRLLNDSKVVNATRFILHADVGLSPIDQMENNYDGSFQTIMTRTIANMRVLDKIFYKNGSISFNTASDRLDIRDGLPMSAIGPGTRITGFNVYGPNNNLIRSVVFDNNNYFDRTGNGYDIRGYTIANERKKALRLNGVKLLDNNGSPNSEYKFEYDPTLLAPLNTTAQDFWGYYNGKLNATFIPQTFYNDIQGVPKYLGDNRKSDFNYMKAASLNKIIFPTGGSISYEYEPNYYLSEAAAGNQVEVSRTVNAYAVNRLASCQPNYLPGVPANNSVDFQVTNLANPVAHLYVMFSDFAVSQGTGMTFDLWQLTDAGSPATLIRHYDRPPSSSTQPLVFTWDFNVLDGKKYRMIANTNGVTGSNVSLCNSPYIEAGVTYTALETTSQSGVNVEQAGGLRVKSITTLNNDNTLVSKKAFEYGEGAYGTNGVGVGKLITDPSHNFYNFPVLYFTLPASATLKNVLWFTSNSQVELGMNSGCPVDYNKVTVKDIAYDQGTNGKTEYYYQSMDGYHEPKSSSMFPYDFIVRPFWTTNNLVRTIYYKGIGAADYTRVKRIETGYEMPEKRVKTLKLVEFEPDIWGAFSYNGGPMYNNNNPDRFYRYNYFEARGKALKTAETVTDYENNGTDSLVTIKQYQYNPYYDLKQETYTDNRSRVVQTNYKYTGDSSYPTLIAKNAVSLPIQIEQIVGGKVRSGSIMRYNGLSQLIEEYAAFSNATPTNYTIASSVPSYYERKKSYTYDADQQNIQSITVESAPPAVYIWSYDGQYPVAEIKNATYSAVETALGGATAVTNFRKSMPTDAQVSSFLAVLRTGLSGAQVTTYTYQPHIGMTSMTDISGVTTYYLYDSYQRLAEVKDKDGKILKNYNYNFAHEPPPLQWNVEQKGTYTKACSTGTGSSVQYIVPAHTYSAATVDAANALAQGDVQANGQTYANNNGFCVTTPYARMVEQSTSTNPNTGTTKVYAFRLYADPDKTISYTTTSSVTIKYKITTTVTNLSGGSPTTTSANYTVVIPANSNQATVSVVTAYCTDGSTPTIQAQSQSAQAASPGDGVVVNVVPTDNCTTRYVELMPGTGYQLYAVID